MNHFKFKGSPGPWFVVQYGPYVSIQTADIYDNGVDVLNEQDFTEEQVLANGKLCACAPEMLEELKFCLFVFELFLHENDRNRIEALLTKATTPC